MFVPQQTMMVCETVEGKPTKAQLRARFILEAEKLVAVPCWKRRGQTVSQSIKLHVRVTEQLVCETCLIYQLGHRDMSTRSDVAAAQRANCSAREKAERRAARHLGGTNADKAAVKQAAA